MNHIWVSVLDLICLKKKKDKDMTFLDQVKSTWDTQYIMSKSYKHQNSYIWLIKLIPLGHLYCSRHNNF